MNDPQDLPPTPPPPTPSLPPNPTPTPVQPDLPAQAESLHTAETALPAPPLVPGRVVNEGKGRMFPCTECGADFEFHIGEQKLKCPFCGTVQELQLDDTAEVREQGFHARLHELQELRASAHPPDLDHNEVRCDSCGSNVIFDGTLTSTECPYCASPIQRENVHQGGFQVPVDAVLPFRVTEQIARQRIAEWVKSRWFAPNKFKQRGIQGRINGVYLPFWTFDSLTYTVYRGEKGIDYTETVGTGDKKRTVTKTRWYPANGQFQRFFDDVLINGSRNLSTSYVEQLEPWPLLEALPFTQQVLAGHFARTYDIELDEAFPRAKRQMEDAIHQECRQRIGGNRQRVHQVNSRFDAITYKHLLLPVYMLAYRYHEKSYRVFINAVTGQVRGERPYSWAKITGTVLTVLALILTFVALANS